MFIELDGTYYNKHEIRSVGIATVTIESCSTNEVRFEKSIELTFTNGERAYIPAVSSEAARILLDSIMQLLNE